MSDESDREWLFDYDLPRRNCWWSTPYIAIRFDRRYWMVSLAAGPFHLSFGYAESY